MTRRLTLATLATMALAAAPAPAQIMGPGVAEMLPNIAAPCPTSNAMTPGPLRDYFEQLQSNSTNGPCQFAPPPYPYYGKYGSLDGITAEAQRISDRLKAFIEQWFADGMPSGREIPASLLPDGRLPQLGKFTLVRPQDVTAREQWGTRPAFDFKPGQPYQYPGKSPAFYPDPHVTYFLNGGVFVPFGTKINLTGEFPRARWFDLQPSPSFMPGYYRENSTLGNMETPITDADIDPEPGSVNLFRVGADRTVPNDRRRYRVTFTAAVGNPTQLDKAATFPFRQDSNHRYMSGIQFQGPWGCESGYKGLGAGRGCWDNGQIWGRYYAPDPPKDGGPSDPFGGVGLPKITYELDGREFYIQVDQSNYQRFYDQKGTPPSGTMREPNAVEGPDEGWHKEFSILRIILQDVLRDSAGGLAPGAAVPDVVDPPGAGARAKYVRDLDRGALGHDQRLPAPNNQEHGATEVPYINYLIRILAKGDGKVVVLTGKLPTTPDTRNGATTMTAAQARYLSFTGYPPPLTSGTSDDTTYANSGGGNQFIGVPLWSLMDDQITTDKNGWYAIVLSGASDRPANATKQAGVTWVNYGPTPEVHVTLRWMSVCPEWCFDKAPTEDRIGWGSDLSSLTYDKALTQNNDTAGPMGVYQPVIHYMTKAQFEALGSQVDPQKVPAWTSAPGSFNVSKKSH